MLHLILGSAILLNVVFILYFVNEFHGVWFNLITAGFLFGLWLAEITDIILEKKWK